MDKTVPTHLSIGIIGAGIAGLASAFALLKNGHQVTIFEKNAELAELGAGIQLSPNATRILAQWGLLSAIQESAVAPIGVRFAHWRNGKTIADFPLNHTSEQAPYLHIHRADLYQCLLNAVRNESNLTFHKAEEFIALKSNETHCQISTKNLKKEVNEFQFDYVIGADGVHSLCREIIAPNSPARFTGNIAWRGLIPVEKLPQHFEKKAHLIMAPGAHLVFYYVKGGKFLNYVAVNEGKRFQQESWTKQGELNDLLTDFSDWHESYLTILKQSDADKLYRWALYDREPLKTWHKGRCIILGDAAHPILPYLSQGAAMAIEDAQCLAQCFSQAINNKTENKIGEKFYAQRALRCTRVLEASRSNMTLYHENNFIKRNVRDLGSRTLSKVYPEFLNKKLDWLYNYQIKDQ